MSTLKIEAYSLFEFCKLVQNAILDGWTFDFNSNELFPTAFGSLLVAGMVKPAGTVFEGIPDAPSEAQLVQETAQVADEVAEEVEQILEDALEKVHEKTQRGRKSKE